MKRTKGQKIFNVFNMGFLILLCVVMLYPYINQIAISFNEGTDSMRGGFMIFPREFTLENYITVFKNDSVISAVGISVSRVILETILSLTVCYSAAYALSRSQLPYRREITLMLMIPSYISAGIIPVYMTLRYYHLINNFLIYVVPHCFVFYNMIVIRSFLQEIPKALEESAKIDGANDIQVMFKIIFPLSLPVVATVALWVAVAAWNDWTTTLMYITDSDLYPLQYIMMKLIKESEVVRQMALESAMGNEVHIEVTGESVKAATLVVTTMPIIMVYPFLQKYFIKGVSLGAVKG